MKKAKIAITIICLLWTAVATVLISEAATTFAGAIVGIDQVQHTITFQTSTGHTWTMPVADSKIMEQPIAKGDGKLRIRWNPEIADLRVLERDRRPGDGFCVGSKGRPFVFNSSDQRLPVRSNSIAISSPPSIAPYMIILATPLQGTVEERARHQEIRSAAPTPRPILRGGSTRQIGCPALNVSDANLTSLSHS